MCGLIVTAWHAHVSAQHPVWRDLGVKVLSLFTSLSKGLYQNQLNLSHKKANFWPQKHWTDWWCGVYVVKYFGGKHEVFVRSFEG